MRGKLPSIFSLLKFRSGADPQLTVRVELAAQQLGSFLKNSRVEQGISIEELAAALFVLPEVMERFEAGEEIHSLDVLVIKQWARELGFKLTLSANPNGALPTADGQKNLYVDL